MDFNSSAGPRLVVGQPHAYLELTPCLPRLDKLRELLAQALYMGPDREDEVTGKMVRAHAGAGAGAGAADRAGVPRRRGFQPRPRLGPADSGGVCVEE